jgi:PhnB protein
MADVAPEELADRFADPAAHEAMAYVQRTLREELVSGVDKTSPSE